MSESSVFLVFLLFVVVQDRSLLTFEFFIYSSLFPFIAYLHNLNCLPGTCNTKNVTGAYTQLD